MTITAVIDKVQFQGNGTTPSFPFAYPFFAPTDLLVLLFDTVAGVAISPPPALNGTGTYDYTVSGTVDQVSGQYLGGGNVTPNSLLPSNLQLTILRALPATQQTSLLDNGPLPAKSIESALDRLTMLLQQVEEGLSRVLAAAATDPNVNLVLPAALARAGKLAGFDAAGAVTTYPVAGTTVGNERIYTNYFAGLTIDNSYSPAEIEEWCAVNFTAGSNGDVTVRVYFPSALPVIATAFVGCVAFNPQAGLNSGFALKSTDFQSYQDVFVYGATPNSTGTVRAIIKGH